jgi:DNA replication and repair protein RecF
VVQLIELRTRDFRNLEDAPVSFEPELNLVLGRNGVGKTSLLEAIVVLGNLRSFRAASARPLVRHGRSTFRLVGRIKVGDRAHRLEQMVEVGSSIQRHLMLDGVPVEVGQYLRLFPVFALSGNDRELVVGPPEGRRALLDRFAFLISPSHLEALRTYHRALRQRNAAISGAGSKDQVSLWEQPLAAAGAHLVDARRGAARRLADNFSRLYPSIAGSRADEVQVVYRVDGWLEGISACHDVEERLRKRYNETRARDCQIGYTVDGPHRHDLGLQTQGRSVRHVLSTGQAKVVAAALRLATHDEIERERKESLPVVVDDVDAELDQETLGRLVDHLGDKRQVFLSSVGDRLAGATRRQGRRVWLDQGACVHRETGSDE